MNCFRRLLGSASSVLLLSVGLVVGTAGPAHAAHVGCGDTIVVSTVLDSDVGPCATGIAIRASNVTFDLNGHTISGNAGPGEGPGVSMENVTGVTVKNGTVTQFDAGVAVTGGSGNTVTNMRVVNNVGSFTTDFGDGIALFRSNNNVITNNQVSNNGPYDGIGLIASNGNLVDSNQVVGNNVSRQDTGIRLENAGLTASNGNAVTNNLVRGSGLDGIEVFAGGSDNAIRFNQVVANTRDGITVFAGGSRNTIEANNVRNNGANGVYIRGAAGNFGAPMNNRILRNRSFANAQFDLRDGTPACGTNEWHGNQGATGTPPCVFNP